MGETSGVAREVAAEFQSIHARCGGGAAVPSSSRRGALARAASRPYPTGCYSQTGRRVAFRMLQRKEPRGLRLQCAPPARRPTHDAIRCTRPRCPRFIRTLTNLKAILEKAAAHAQRAQDRRIGRSWRRGSSRTCCRSPGRCRSPPISRAAPARASPAPRRLRPRTTRRRFAELVARVDRTHRLPAHAARRPASTARRRARSSARSRGEPKKFNGQRLPAASSRCRISTSTRPRPTRSCGTTASRSARAISSAACG